MFLLVEILGLCGSNEFLPCCSEPKNGVCVVTGDRYVWRLGGYLPNPSFRQGRVPSCRAPRFIVSKINQFFLFNQVFQQEQLQHSGASGLRFRVRHKKRMKEAGILDGSSVGELGLVYRDDVSRTRLKVAEDGKSRHCRIAVLNHFSTYVYPTVIEALFRYGNIFKRRTDNVGAASGL